MLIYALVNSAFSGFASLKLHLFIQPLGKNGDDKFTFSHPLFVFYAPTAWNLRLALSCKYCVAKFGVLN